MLILNWQHTLVGWWILNASYKWQMGNGIFVFDLFSLMSSAACSLIGVLLAELPSFHAAVGAGEHFRPTWQPCALWAATHSTTSLTLELLKCRLHLFMGINAEVAVAMLRL